MTTSPHPNSWITPSVPPPAAGTRTPHKTPSPVEGTSSPVPAAPRKRKKSRPSAERQPTPDHLTIKRWHDPLLGDGFPATGFYVQRYYAPILGPTCMLLIQSLAQHLRTDLEGFSIETAELASAIGCSSMAGANSQFWKALRRGARFGIIRQVDDVVAVRTELSYLPGRMVQRLPQHLRHEHRVWSAVDGPSASELLGGQMPREPLAPLEVLRLAARGLCTPAELRSLDRARKLA